jgi:hypothetical protein
MELSLRGVNVTALSIRAPRLPPYGKQPLISRNHNLANNSFFLLRTRGILPNLLFSYRLNTNCTEAALEFRRKL